MIHTPMVVERGGRRIKSVPSAPPHHQGIRRPYLSPIFIRSLRIDTLPPTSEMGSAQKLPSHVRMKMAVRVAMAGPTSGHTSKMGGGFGQEESHTRSQSSPPTHTFTMPPAGTCPTLSREPTFAWAFSLKFSFWFSILTSPPPGTTSISRQASGYLWIPSFHCLSLQGGLQTQQSKSDFWPNGTYQEY